MKAGLKELVIYHKTEHPSMDGADVYKMLFQGTMGPAHLMKNTDIAFSELKKEFKRAKTCGRKDEKLLEAVSIGGAVVRVNLRPYNRRGGEIEQLFKIMEVSARKFIPNKKKLIRLWADFKSLVQKGLLEFDYREVLELDTRIKQKENIVISHSEIYRKKEKPTYRVVLASVFKQSFPQFY